MKFWPTNAWRYSSSGPSVASTFEAMTITPFSLASFRLPRNALLSTSVVISASGLRASAACWLATSCSIEPSVWVKIIWQFAWIFAQASSKPFFTACQNGFDGRRVMGEDDVELFVRGRPDPQPDGERRDSRRTTPRYSRSLCHLVVPPLSLCPFDLAAPCAQRSSSVGGSRSTVKLLVEIGMRARAPSPGPRRHGDDSRPRSPAAR